MKKIIHVLCIIAFVISCIFAIRYIVTYPTSPDTYLHMGTGRFVIEERRIPNHGDISFKKTTPSLEWIGHSWLADSLIYLATDKSVVLGAVLLTLPLLALSLFLLNKILITLEIGWQFQALYLSIAAALSMTFWKINPLMFQPALMLTIIYLYFLWHRTGSKNIYLLPLLLVVWANISGGFIFIPIFFVILCLAYEIVIVKRKNHAFLYIGLISIFAPLLNPLGLRIYTYFFTFIGVMTNKWFNSLSDTLGILNQSFLKNTPSTILFILVLTYIITLLALTCILLIRAKQNYLKHLGPFALLLYFVLLMLGWTRFTAIGVFTTIPLIATGIGYFSKHISTKIREILSLIFLSLFVIGYTTLLILLPKPIISDPPAAQIDYIVKNALPTNLLTSFDITPYAYYRLYPAKMLIDAQDDIFDDNELLNIFGYSNPIDEKTLNAIVDNNNVHSVLVHKDLGNLAITFSGHPQWALLYLDTNGFLYTDKHAVSDELIQKNSLKTVLLSNPNGFSPEQLDESIIELKRFVKNNPTSKLAIGQLASLYRYKKDYVSASETLEKIPESKWDYAVKTEMARIQAARGFCRSAEYWFHSALTDRPEQNYSRTVLDLAVLYAGCFKDKEKSKHYFERYNSYVLPPIERERIKQMAIEFGIQLGEN